MKFCPWLAARFKNEPRLLTSEVIFQEKETKKNPSKSKSVTSQAFNLSQLYEIHVKILRVLRIMRGFSQVNMLDLPQLLAIVTEPY